jgi:hypothetical protein
MSSIRVTRFDAYPPSAPTSYAIGFVETCNSHTKYADTTVPFAETAAGLTNDEIAAMAWRTLEPDFAAWRAAVSSIPSIIGTEFSPYPPPPPPVLTLEDAQAAALAALADRRYAAETGGIAVDNLGMLPTDRGSQAMLTSSLEFLNLMPGTAIPWKLGNGQFINLTLDHLQELGKVVGAHVLACFVNEARLADLIRAATTIEDVRSLSLDDGWPTASVTIPGLVLPTSPPPPPTEPLPTDPTDPTDPTEPPTEPSVTDPATEPPTEPTEPSTEPTEPSTEPTEPSTEPTEPSVTEPAPTEPSASTEPSVTDPAPTEPSVTDPAPTEPPTDPAPTDPAPTEPPTDP